MRKLTTEASHDAEFSLAVVRVNQIVEKYAPVFQQIRKVEQAFREELSSCGVYSIHSAVLAEAVPVILTDDLTSAILAPAEELERMCGDIEKRFYQVARIAGTLAMVKDAVHA